MLILTCRIGETIRIGNDLSVTLQSRCRGRVAVAVVTSAGAELYFDNVSLQPFVLPDGAQSYLFSMQAVRRFRVGEVEVNVWLPGDALSLAADCDDYIHLGVDVPATCQVYREKPNDDMPPMDMRFQTASSLLRI